MSKKNKKCQCENKEELNEECTCHENECCSDECCCNEDTCCCGEGCECSNEDINTTDLLSNRIKELNEAVLRSQAELLNYKKRKDEETARILKYAEKDILEGFLPILDNFERAISMDDNNFGDETSKFLEGFRMVYNQTRALLEKFEVKEIDCLGKEFDPSYAQAVVVEKNEEKESGVVLEVLQKGYMYKDRVLRIAMVKVNE
jgi:molecular chaperone GrpE